jgi:hypothetical protein
MSNLVQLLAGRKRDSPLWEYFEYGAACDLVKKFSFLAIIKSFILPTPPVIEDTALKQHRVSSIDIYIRTHRIEL